MLRRPPIDTRSYTHFPYTTLGRDDDEVIWSVSRGELNITLIDAAEAAGAVLHFDRGLESVDFDARTITCRGDGETHTYPFTALLGCDGAGSTLRAQMGQRSDLGERTEWLGHGYKELEIPRSEEHTSELQSLMRNS